MAGLPTAVISPQRRWFRIALACGIAAASGSVASRASVHALLVGINDYPGRYALSSPRRDVAAVREVLVERLHWPETQVQTLLDGEVTRARLEEEFRRWLIDETNPGDSVLFYFSGHGSFILDENGDEPDGTDEVLVLSGASETPPVSRDALLVDDDLGAWLGKIPAAARVYVILDACHSGTGTRAPNGNGQAKSFDLGFRRPQTRGAPATSGGASANDPDFRSGTLVLAASRANQVSWATRDGESLFTGALVAMLRANSAAVGADFERDVTSAVKRDSLLTFATVQTPQLEGPWSAPLPQGASVAADETAPTPAAAPATPVPESPPANLPANIAFGGVELRVSQARYRVGEKVVVTLRSPRDAWVQLYHTSADGEVQLIFPNTFQTANRVRAGELVEFPAPGAPFQFTVTLPSGTERVTAVVSDAPLADPPGLKHDANAGPFFAHDELRPSSPQVRGLRVEAAAQSSAGGKPTKPAAVSTATVEYYVEE